MGLHWKEWNRNDIIYGIIAPLLVVLLIVGISKLGSLFGGGFGIVFGITMEIEELVVIAGVPLVLGLVWNRWAGGASGFLTRKHLCIILGKQLSRNSGFWNSSVGVYPECHVDWLHGWSVE